MPDTPSQFHFVPAAIVALLLVGCSSAPPRNAAPDSVDKDVTIAGIPDARFWGDRKPARADERILNRTRDEVRSQFPAMFGNPHNYLALSGGGSDGAFGAGLLIGWTEAGDRPEFQIVTGISTGALIAPWAFLGPGYDQTLKELYTTTSTKDILRSRWLPSALFGEAAADSTPLLNKIREYVEDDVIKAIAAEHKKGRRLFIGTTTIDHMRPMIWDIGAIASSGRPEAKDLVHRVMLASASIPGAFPPVKINVEANGVQYDELHVDGGTTNQVFVYPPALDWRKYLEILEVPGKANIYVIRNSKLTPRRKVIEQKLLPIARQSISSLIRTQGIGDLNLIFVQSHRDDHNFNLAYIPSDFMEESREHFDKAYMNKLFELGYSLSKDGYQWSKKPPDLLGK
ncbi:MAG: patatin [Gammaproteobacteria bacterium]|nr:MAG: patatin [Gammaproteobacteria bacterium]